jgi:hypothetical protein
MSNKVHYRRAEYEQWRRNLRLVASHPDHAAAVLKELCILVLIFRPIFLPGVAGVG